MSGDIQTGPINAQTVSDLAKFAERLRRDDRRMQARIVALEAQVAQLASRATANENDIDQLATHVADMEA